MVRNARIAGRWCAAALAGWLACAGALAQQDSGPASSQPAQTAPDAQLFEPSVITMHYKDAPLQGVLEDFAHQAGADLGIDRHRIVDYSKSRRISIDLEHADFWSALHAISDRSGLRPQPYASDARMVFQVNANAMFGGFDMFSDAAKVSGGFLVIPWTCRLNRSVDYEHDGSSQSDLWLELIVMAEPKLRVIAPSNQEWLRECVDEQGQSLVGNRRQSRFFNNGRSWWWTMQANLREVPHMGQRIARLRGELKFTVQSKSELIEIDDLGKLPEQSRTAGNRTITFHQFTSQNGLWKLHLSIVNSAARPGARPGANLFSTLQILDSQNQPYPQVGVSSSVHGQESDVTLNFVSYDNEAQIRNLGQMAGLGPPAKLRWEVPTETRLITVPFELNDLAMPSEP